MTNESDDTIRNSRDWKRGGFSKDLSRETPSQLSNKYIAGTNFDASLDDVVINRMLQFKRLDKTPQGNDIGKTYFDRETKKLYMWIDATGKWAEILYTTTSTSTTTTSSSSSSVSTTSTSVTTTSTSSSSISTTSTSTTL